LSNYRYLYADTTQGFFGSLAFSPNSRFLYVGTQFKLWQFDTEAPDIQASKILIDEYDGYKYAGVFATLFSYMQLGPDCKIYMVSHNGADILHVIYNPDEPGPACNFKQHDIKLPAVNGAASQPNFPNYRLGTPYPVCDSNIVYVSASVPLPPPQVAVQVFPNPASEEIHIALPAPLPTPAEWWLYNTVGQMVQRSVVPAGQREQSLSLSSVPPGLYFWQMRVEGRRMGSGKVVVAK
jgi:type IX secretion system substrate protein